MPEGRPNERIVYSRCSVCNERYMEGTQHDCPVLAERRRREEDAADRARDKKIAELKESWLKCLKALSTEDRNKVWIACGFELLAPCTGTEEECAKMMKAINKKSAKTLRDYIIKDIVERAQAITTEQVTKLAEIIEEASEDLRRVKELEKELKEAKIKVFLENVLRNREAERIDLYSHMA